MRRSTGILLSILLIAVISAPWVDAANPAQPQTAQLTRTTYVEPSYQVYVDEVSLSQPSNTYNLTFALPAPSVVFDVKAFGPQNQSLAVTQIPQNTNGTFNGNLTMSVDTAGLPSFRLVTIIQGMTYSFGNFTTIINFFPVVDETTPASVIIYLPLGSTLISYSLDSLSNSTEGSRPTIFGSRELIPNNATYGTVSFAGNFSTVVAEYLHRTIRILPSSVEFGEAMTLVNSGTTFLSAVMLGVPAGSSFLWAYDTIGALSTNVAGGIVTVTLRNNIYHNEKVQFTLVYTLPSSTLRVEGGRTIVSGNVLPEWFNMPCSAANVTVVMPTWSSDPQMPGGSVDFKYYGPVTTANFTKVSPHTNQAFAASFIPPSFGVTTLTYIAIAVIATVIIALMVVKWRFFPGKKEALPEVKKDTKRK